MRQGLVYWEPSTIDQIELTVLHCGLDISLCRLVELIVPELEELQVAKRERPVAVGDQLLQRGVEDVVHAPDEAGRRTFFIQIIVSELAELLLKLLVRRQVVSVRVRNDVQYALSLILLLLQIIDGCVSVRDVLLNVLYPLNML